MTDETANTEQSRDAADCPNERLVRGDFLGTTDHDFSAFVDSMPDKHWAKYDLSAVRLGWEAHKAQKKTKTVTVSVSADVLRSLLQAVNGPAHYIRELQATRGIDESNPINVLISEYNAAVEMHNEENGESA